MSEILYYIEKGWDSIRERSTSYEVYNEKKELLTICKRDIVITWRPEFELICHVREIGMLGNYKFIKLS